jgi:hypothetical protein
MRTETTTRTLYKFEELSDDAQQHALEKLWNLNVDHDWWECIYETITAAARCLGIDCTVGGCDLGRGQSIGLRGAYEYRKGWRAALAQEFDGDTLAELVGIGEELQSAQRRAFYLASIELHPVTYGTAYTVYSKFGAYVTGDLTDALRSFEHWAWRLLHDGYEYLTSDDAIKETIEANEYDFDENGNLA